MKLLFFGDGDWAAGSLRRIARRRWDILGVVQRFRPSSSSLAEAARELGLPLLAPRQANSEEFLAVVRSLSPDVNVSVSYDQIVRRPLLDTAPLGFVNFHAGKLPRYRGRNVINWAILNGETEIGITAHYMDEGIDTGDVLLQRTLPIGWTDTYGSVLERVVGAFPDLVDESLGAIAEGRATRTAQDHANATYFGGRGDGDEWLDWSDTSRNLHNKVRGIARPGPGARTTVDGQSVVIWSAFYEPAWPAYLATPGQVVGRRHDGALVKTGDSVLLIREIQAGLAPPSAPRWKVGTRLGAGTPASRSAGERLATPQKESGRTRP